MIEQIKETHALVWRVRCELESEGSRWVTPPPRTCQLFALSELGEAADALTVLDGDVLAELADLAIMLMSLMSSVEFRRRTSIKGAAPFDDIVRYVLFFYIDPLDRNAEKALLSIANYPGMDLLREVKKRLARIVGKHGVLAYGQSADSYLDKWQRILGDAF